MIEGQEDVTWDDWRALAAACEEHGIETLFRSDHYLSVFGRRERGSLDAWATINALAAITATLRLGTLVSPATFRHPSELAKVVVTADHVSGGRVELGLGTGWSEAEHEAYGFAFPPMGERMKQHRGAAAADRAPLGRRAERSRSRCSSRGPNLIVGGRGGPRSIRIAARYADEYNTVNKTAAECAEIREQLDAACAAEGRDPIPLSLMASWLAGEDRAELLDRAARLAEWQAQDTDAGGLPGRASRTRRRRHASTRTSSDCASWPRRRRARDAASTCCTATWTRSSRSGAAWRPPWPTPSRLPRRGRPLDLQGVRRARHLPGSDGRGARLPDRARASRACWPTCRARRPAELRVGLGRDMRLSAPSMAEAYARGIADEGATCSTSGWSAPRCSTGRSARASSTAGDVHRLAQPEGLHGRQARRARARSRCRATRASASCATS